MQLQSQSQLAGPFGIHSGTILFLSHIPSRRIIPAFHSLDRLGGVVSQHLESGSLGKSRLWWPAYFDNFFGVCFNRAHIHWDCNKAIGGCGAEDFLKDPPWSFLSFCEGTIPQNLRTQLSTQWFLCLWSKLERPILTWMWKGFGRAAGGEVGAGEVKCALVKSRSPCMVDHLPQVYIQPQLDTSQV